MSKSVIYCLISESKKLIYIGKTRQGSQRIVKHRHDYKRYKMGQYGFCSSYKVIECPDSYFFVLRHIGENEDINEAEKKAIQYHRDNDEYKIVNIKHNH